jgi:hypothetical protein
MGCSGPPPRRRRGGRAALDSRPPGRAEAAGGPHLIERRAQHPQEQVAPRDGRRREDIGDSVGSSRGRRRPRRCGGVHAAPPPCLGRGGGEGGGRGRAHARVSPRRRWQWRGKGDSGGGGGGGGGGSHCWSRHHPCVPRVALPTDPVPLPPAVRPPARLHRLLNGRPRHMRRRVDGLERGPERRVGRGRAPAARVLRALHSPGKEARLRVEEEGGRLGLEGRRGDRGADGDDGLTRHRGHRQGRGRGHQGRIRSIVLVICPALRR